MLAPGRKEELYSWDAEVHLHRRLFLGTVTNIIETFVFRQESVCAWCFRVQECVTYQSSGSFSVIWRGDAHLSHSSLNLELSELIVLKLIWPSSGTF